MTHRRTKASMPRLLILAGGAAVLVFTAGSVGCGGEDELPEARVAPAPAPARLTAEERRALGRYDRLIQGHCVRVAESILGSGAGPSARQEMRAFAAADALVALAAEKPGAPLGAGQDTRLFLSDVLENLDGSNCDPRMTALLGQGLAQIPPEG